MSHSTSTHTQKVLPKASDHHTAGRTHAIHTNAFREPRPTDTGDTEALSVTSLMQAQLICPDTGTLK